MAKKSNSSTKSSQSNRSIIEGQVGYIASLICAVGVIGGACYFVGYHARMREYESQIEDLKFEIIQIQLEYQNKLTEEKTKWEHESRTYSIDELKELLSIPVTIVSNGK